MLYINIYIWFGVFSFGVIYILKFEVFSLFVLDVINEKFKNTCVFDVTFLCEELMSYMIKYRLGDYYDRLQFYHSTIITSEENLSISCQMHYGNMS